MAEGLGALIEGAPWEIGEAPWIEETSEYLEYVKSGSKFIHTTVDIFHDHWESFKATSEKIDGCFRKWIDGSEVDTQREYKQFYGIFRTDAGRDALNRFVHSLIDRYARQLQLLEPEGAEQLAEAIDEHLGRLFLLNFDRWNLPRWGAQKHAMMLDIMRQWVTYMGFLKEKAVKLASGQMTTAQALLQQCGVYFEGNQQPIQIDVIMDWDVNTKIATMSNSGRYGHRKAEGLLVEEFKAHVQNGGQQLQALQQFVGQKTPEELEMIKELGDVMGVQFDSDTLSFFQDIKDITPCEEVVWQSLEERTQVNEEKLEDIAETVSEMKGDMGILQNQMGHLQKEMGALKESNVSTEDTQTANNPSLSQNEPAQVTMSAPKGFVTQETYNIDMGLVKQQLKDREDKLEKAKEEIAVTNEKLTQTQVELQEVNDRIDELVIGQVARDRILEQQAELFYEFLEDPNNSAHREKASKLRQAIFELKKSPKSGSFSQSKGVIDRNEHNSAQASYIQKKSDKKDENPNLAPIPPILPSVIETKVFNSPISQPQVSTQSTVNFPHQQSTEDKAQQDEIANIFSLGPNDRVCFPDWYMTRLN